MTSKERVLRALNHQEPCQIPIRETGIDSPITEKVWVEKPTGEQNGRQM